MPEGIPVDPPAGAQHRGGVHRLGMPASLLTPRCRPPVTLRLPTATAQARTRTTIHSGDPDDRLAAQAAREQAVLDAALDCIVVIDGEGRILEWNRSAERTFGYARDEAVGQELGGLVVPPALREAHRAGLRRYTAGGPPAILGRRIEITGMRADGTEFPVELTVVRVDLPGPPVFTGYMRDISERRRAEAEMQRLLDLACAAREVAERSQERLELLAEVGLAVLEAPLSPRARLERLASLVVPGLGDRAAVWALGADGNPDLVSVVEQGRAEAAGMPGRTPAAPWGAAVVEAVLRTGKPARAPDLDDHGAGDDEQALAMLRETGFVSYLCVPISARGQAFGALAVADGARRYGAADLALAEEIARRAAVAMDNARLYVEEQALSQALQRSLLPPTLPQIPHLRLALAYRPVGRGVAVGGDFCDAFATSDTTWCLLLGDVCGKGPEAAGLGALARHAVRTAALSERSPRRLLGLLNEVVLRYVEGFEYLTAVCACVSQEGGDMRLVLAAAAHPPPLVLRADGRVAVVPVSGPVAGVDAEVDFLEVRVALGPGDSLLLYTDGASEARRGGRLLGVDGLGDRLAGCAGLDAQEIAARIEQAVVDFQAGELRDDLAVLVVQATG